jgi:hypothetical protein
MNKPEDRGLVVYQDRYGMETKLSFDLVKQYLVVGRPELVTKGEMMHFIAECKARQLNPYRRDCYIVKFTQKDTAAIITAKDYFVSRGDAQKSLQWWEAGIIVTRDCRPCNSTGLIKDKPCDLCKGEGVIEIKRNGALPRNGDTLIGGWFEAKKSTRERPNYLEVDLQGYIKKTSQGEITRFWKPVNQPMMIRKVALSQGFRETYPDEFKNLYDSAEIDIPDGMDLPEEAIDVEGVDVTPSRDLATEANIADDGVTPITKESMNDVPEIFGEEPTEEATPGDIEQAAKEAAAASTELTEEQEAEVEYRAMLKTFDVKEERLDSQRKSILNVILFEYLEKSKLDNLPDLKVEIVKTQDFDKLMDKVEERYKALNGEGAPLEEEGEKPWLDEKDMLARIEKAKTGGMKKLVEEWSYMFDDTTFHAKHGQVVMEFASKYNRLMDTNIYGPGQPWEHPPGERGQKREPEIKPSTPMTDSYVTAITDMVTKMTAKMGAERADGEFMRILGVHGYEDYKEIPDHETRSKFFKDLGETLK